MHRTCSLASVNQVSSRAISALAWHCSREYRGERSRLLGASSYIRISLFALWTLLILSCLFPLFLSLSVFPSPLSSLSIFVCLWCYAILLPGRGLFLSVSPLVSSLSLRLLSSAHPLEHSSPLSSAKYSARQNFSIMFPTSRDYRILISYRCTRPLTAPLYSQAIFSRCLRVSMQSERCWNTMSSPRSPSVSLSHFVRTPGCTVTLARSSRSTRFSRLHLFFRQPRFSFHLSRFKGASLLCESFRLSAHQYSLSSDACVRTHRYLLVFSPLHRAEVKQRATKLSFYVMLPRYVIATSRFVCIAQGRGVGTTFENIAGGDANCTFLLLASNHT